MRSREIGIEGGSATELYPPAYDWVFSAVVLVAVALAAVALVRLWRSPDTGVVGVLSLVLVLVVPVLGPSVYLFLSRRRGAHDRRPVGVR